MNEITGGELLLQCLKAEGIDRMFGIVDGSHVPFVGLTPGYGISYINAHHEEAAVHMAESYTRFKRKISVVIGNPGPGGANMVAGLSGAYGDGYPVLAIACTRRTATTQPDRGGAWQATDLYEMAKPVTKFCAYVTRADRIPELTRAACRAAMTGRPGPAMLVIPDEMLALKIDTANLRIISSEKYRVHNIGSGDPQSVHTAAEWLAAAGKIFIHAGKGVIWADADKELLALSDYLGAALGSTLGARGTVPENHPNFFNGLDMPAVTMARTEADVVLIVGARMGEYDGWGMPPLWGDPIKQKTIQIDTDPLSMGLNRPVDLAIVADAKKALVSLLEEIKALTAPRESNPGIEAYRKATALNMEQLKTYLQLPAARGVNPAGLMTALRQSLSKDTITVLDGGNTALLASIYFSILAPDSYIYSVKMGYLGTGLPYAIGAKAAHPNRQVCLITGDGALGFCIMEMETALRHKLPLMVIVAVDGSWGMEKSAFLSRGFREDQFVDIDIDAAVRYDRMAEAMGCHGAYVDNIDKLPEALEQAAASGKPSIIHVGVDPALNANPPGRDQFKYVRSV
jgi:acetolactate synthase-1/2/3 large subunit